MHQELYLIQINRDFPTIYTFLFHLPTVFSTTSNPLPENALSIELPDLLSTFSLFQKSLQNP